jgi:lysophospholipase L1-like esterase
VGSLGRTAGRWGGATLLILAIGGVAYEGMGVVRDGAVEAAARRVVEADRVVGGDAHPSLPSSGSASSVVLWGDSLTWESRGVVQTALSDRSDLRFETRAFGGTAPCDWLTDMAARAAGVDVAVLQFSGNSYGNCMKDPGTGELLEGDAVVDKYERDVRYAIEQFRSHGARVLLVGSPPPPDATVAEPRVAVQQVYRALAVRIGGVDYVEAAAAVLDRGRWTATLPCLPVEDESRGCRGDHIRVRAPDGLHFCPVVLPTDDGVVGGCPVWSSGAYRFGNAIADAIDERVPAAASRA